MNMFKPTDAKTVEEYLAMLSDERRELLEELITIIKKEAPELKEYYANNMPAYGSFTYTNYKKEQVKWPVIAVASQKNNVSVYVCATSDGEYLAEKYEEDLGKVSVGKSCIRIKKLDDLHIATFKKLIREASKNPGLVAAGEHK